MEQCNCLCSFIENVFFCCLLVITNLLKTKPASNFNCISEILVSFQSYHTNIAERQRCVESLAKQYLSSSQQPAECSCIKLNSLPSQFNNVSYCVSLIMSLCTKQKVAASRRPGQCWLHMATVHMLFCFSSG